MAMLWATTDTVTIAGSEYPYRTPINRFHKNRKVLKTLPEKDRTFRIFSLHLYSEAGLLECVYIFVRTPSTP